jgi:hypothetical protein
MPHPNIILARLSRCKAKISTVVGRPPDVSPTRNRPVVITLHLDGCAHLDIVATFGPETRRPTGPVSHISSLLVAEVVGRMQRAEGLIFQSRHDALVLKGGVDALGRDGTSS